MNTLFGSSFPKVTLSFYTLHPTPPSPTQMVSANTAPVDQRAYLKETLPYVVSWPQEASDDFFAHVFTKYFSTTSPVNWFDCCILIHRAETPQEALRALESAFSTRMGRDTLLKIVSEARNSQWCKQDVLDCIERYATYAFVLDGTRVTYGAIPV